MYQQLHVDEMLTIPEASKIFNMSKWALYQLIRSESSFPHRNVGLKKKYVISKIELSKWLSNRCPEQPSAVPTGDEILRRIQK